MGFQCAIQMMGLVRGDPRGTRKIKGKMWKTGKHRANGKAILGEAGKERVSNSATLDRSLSHLNRYEGESDSGFAVWDKMKKRADEYKAEVVTKDSDGNPIVRHRSLREDAVIGCGIIINPPYEVAKDWSREKYDKFYSDSLEILYEAMPDIFRDENCRFTAYHVDEGLKTIPPQLLKEHLHKAFECLDKDGHYCGNKINGKFFSKFNQIYPQKMRERGWDMDDLDVTDWDRFNSDPEYQAERKAKLKNSGKSVNKYIYDKAAGMMEEANEVMIDALQKECDNETEKQMLEQASEVVKIDRKSLSYFSGKAIESLGGDRKEYKSLEEKVCSIERLAKDYKTKTDEAAKKETADAYKQVLDDMNAELEEMRKHKKKTVDDDSSRKKWMEDHKSKDGVSIEDRYQADLAKHRSDMEASMKRMEEIAEKYNAMYENDFGMSKE